MFLEYKTPPAFLNDSLPDTIASNDVYLFLDARKNSAKLISDVCIIDIFISCIKTDLFSVRINLSIQLNPSSKMQTILVGRLILSSVRN